MTFLCWFTAGAFNNDQMQGALGAEGSDETTGSGNKSSLQAMDDAHGTASGFKRSEGEASDRRAEGSEHHLSGGPSAAAKETGGGNPLSQVSLSVIALCRHTLTALHVFSTQEGWTEGGSNQGKMGGKSFFPLGNPESASSKHCL